MAKKRRKKKSILHSTFYRVYFAVVLLCLIGIGVGAHWLSGLLADYESAQPSHVAETAARMFENEDFETIFSYDTSAPELAGGDEAYYIDSMREIANGKDVSWIEAYSPNSDEKRYNVRLDGENFAEISLIPSGQTSKHGYTIWTLGSITTFVTMSEEQSEPEAEPQPVEEVPAGIPCRVTVPSEFAVTVDGAALTRRTS